MSHKVTIELEDDDFEMLLKVAEASGLSVEAFLRVTVIFANKTYAMNVANPDMAIELMDSEAGQILNASMRKTMERAREKEAG